MSDVSEETLLDYFSSTGGGSGRVKNADMLKTFKPFIGHADLQLRAKYREEFKLIIDRIAVVKSENGEKYLVLKKKYRQMLHERDAKHFGTDGDGQRHPSPARTPATVQWDTTDASTSSSSPRHQKEQDEREPDGAAEAGLCRPRSCVSIQWRFTQRDSVQRRDADRTVVNVTDEKKGKLVGVVILRHQEPLTDRRLYKYMLKQISQSAGGSIKTNHCSICFHTTEGRPPFRSGLGPAHTRVPLYQNQTG
ncbi:Ankyrin repeat domain-containing protein SOWAHB [Collichthys lucidus]|uniref:Ankyrin repeat domain-containing protein SOWAHB n=1 Tax=Collichthys lucidus TaxID=240159 RepID=A0A4U5UPA0_COLLU|nr:Ankyrin repeat domain-containing protein SOWAHB [Collichthys lucidus]